MLSCNPTSPLGERWFRSPLSTFPSSPIPFGERFTSPLPLSVVLSPRGPELPGPPLAAQSPSRSDPKIHQFFRRFLNPVWCRFGSQNDFQIHPKSLKNQSKTESGLKNVIFSKIAPRLHENTIFEDSGSPKPSQN